MVNTLRNRRAILAVLRVVATEYESVNF